jgi:hypothetical protein
MIVVKQAKKRERYGGENGTPLSHFQEDLRIL